MDLVEVCAYMRERATNCREQVPDLEEGELADVLNTLEAQLKAMPVLESRTHVRKTLWETFSKKDPSSQIRNVIDLCFPSQLGPLERSFWKKLELKSPGKVSRPKGPVLQPPYFDSGSPLKMLARAAEPSNMPSSVRSQGLISTKYTEDESKFLALAATLPDWLRNDPDMKKKIKEIENKNNASFETGSFGTSSRPGTPMTIQSVAPPSPPKTSERVPVQMAPIREQLDFFFARIMDESAEYLDLSLRLSKSSCLYIPIWCPSLGHEAEELVSRILSLKGFKLLAKGSIKELASMGIPLTNAQDDYQAILVTDAVSCERPRENLANLFGQRTNTIVFLSLRGALSLNVFKDMFNRKFNLGPLLFVGNLTLSERRAVWDRHPCSQTYTDSNTIREMVLHQSYNFSPHMYLDLLDLLAEEKPWCSNGALSERVRVLVEWIRRCYGCSLEAIEYSVIDNSQLPLSQLQTEYSDEGHRRRLMQEWVAFGVKKDLEWIYCLDQRQALELGISNEVFMMHLNFTRMYIDLYLCGL